MALPADLGKRTLTALVLGGVALAADLAGPEAFFALLIATAAALCWEWRRLSTGQGRRARRAAQAFLWFAPALLAAAWLREAHGPAPVIWAAGIVIAADVGAYLFGRAFGRKPLIPSVSPAKTWAGFYGGVAAAAAVGGALGLILGDAWVWAGLPVGVAVGLASVAGDLIESVAKRRAGVKDSGGVLPGHGGVLDRLDSHLTGMPVFAIAAFVLGWPA